MKCHSQQIFPNAVMDTDVVQVVSAILYKMQVTIKLLLFEQYLAKPYLKHI